MLPEIKVYKVDYDFIISNYLDKSLWKKTWNLFVYKDYVFTLSLHRIETKTDRITFEIGYNKIQWNHEYVTYDIQQTSIDILKRQINGAIFRLMEFADRNEAYESTGYNAIKSARRDEEDRLRDIAEAYLDDHGIELEDVREAYIDRYVSRNSKVDAMLNNYLDGCKYTFLSELLLVFTKVVGDETRYNEVCKAVGNKGNIALIESAVEEFLEHMDSSDYEDEMIGELESL